MPGKDNISSLFDRSGNLTPEAMRRFLNGELTPEERALVEEHLAKSEFDREALEGYRLSNPEDIPGVVSEINEKVEKIAAERKLQPGSRRKQRYYWVAAASLLIVATFTALLFFMFRNDARVNELAMKSQDRVAAPSAQNLPEEQQRDFADMDQEIMADPVRPPMEEEKAAEAPQRDEPRQVATITPLEDKVVINEDIVIDIEADMDVMEEVSPAVPSVGGITSQEFGGGAAEKQKSAREAMPSVDARQFMEMPEEQVPDSTVFVVVEEMPLFPGGEDGLIKYFNENIQYPDSAKESGIQGRVFVTFIVEKDGSVSHVKLLRGIGGGCDEEAIRVVREMPKWTPARQRNQPVRVQYNLPVKFTLQ